MSETSTTIRSNWLGSLWRLLVLPMSYPIFVVGSLIMLALVPVSLLRHRSTGDRTRWLRHALHRGAKLWVNFNQKLGILQLAVDDKRQSDDNQPAAGQPLIVIANHPSLIDVLLITATVPNLCCVLKGTLHYNPLFTLLIRHLDYLPNSNPEQMLAEGTRRLEAGERLLIFPEGTRTAPSGSAESGAHSGLLFRFGAAELALRSGAATLPITIHCNSSYLGKGHPWYQWPADSLRYRLEIGPTLLPCERLPLGANGVVRRKARRALNERWQTHFAQRLATQGVGN